MIQRSSVQSSRSGSQLDRSGHLRFVQALSTALSNVCIPLRRGQQREKKIKTRALMMKRTNHETASFYPANKIPLNRNRRISCSSRRLNCPAAAAKRERKGHQILMLDVWEHYVRRCGRKKKKERADRGWNLCMFCYFHSVLNHHVSPFLFIPSPPPCRGEKGALVMRYVCVIDNNERLGIVTMKTGWPSYKI